MLERYFRPFEAGRGLQEQLRENLLNAILDGALPPDDAMPSSRKLCELLKVSRNTVVLVYEQLVQDGYLTPSDRRGYFINEKFLRQQLNVSLKAKSPALFERPDHAPDWERRLQTDSAQMRSIVKPRNWRDYRYPFIYGQIEDDEQTAARWRDCARIATSGAHMRSWVDDQVMLDDPLLVEQIIQRVLPKRGIQAGPEQVLVTIGTQNSLYMLTRLLGRPGLQMGLEEPGYVDARNIFSLSGCTLRPLRIDRQGLVVDEQLRGCDMLFCTPSHQSPTGVTMPLYRRLELLASAREHDFLIIEDDYESEQNFLGSNHPALKSYDDSGRVIYLGSLTKGLLPGVRLGFIAADAELIHELRALRRYMYRHPPSNNQRILALFLAMGHYDAHARRLRDRLARKWRVISRALAEHLPECHASGMAGGSSIWVSGPPSVDAWALQRRVARHGVLIEPGDIHFLGEGRGGCYFRLGFGAIAEDRIEAGIAALGQAWRELHQAQPA
ncbi:MocR-like pyridoxine biosynthesis transcription factor PdxR [Pseudomonas poae]|uniref:GntR family transcriptional regulator n=1 Tax=Pseudomonas poae TaxID=200451 RepID=A0A2S9E791_9PSED|nr:PLP-dependent aminotransferase family protein [Pseudomonas poae]PRA24903.1 GntR family transcriptional regulator [Pseudomonas poae]PRC10726.1 GntR family transcriptional regulator [Pseudomonas poae]